MTDPNRAAPPTKPGSRQFRSTEFELPTAVRCCSIPE
jgi:hypothetical protein